MDIQALLQELQAASFAVAVRENDFLFPSIEGIHILSATLVVGSVGFVDLRLLGVAALSRSIRYLMADVLPFTWIAFTCAVLSGATLFASAAVDYSRNVPFRMKLLVLGVAGLNMLIFHSVTCRTISRWNEAVRTPLAARLAGAVSLLLWIGVIACGRWIGFTMTP